MSCALPTAETCFSWLYQSLALFYPISFEWAVDLLLAFRLWSPGWSTLLSQLSSFPLSALFKSAHCYCQHHSPHSSRFCLACDSFCSRVLFSYCQTLLKKDV
jgi:hypothetical protein